MCFPMFDEDQSRIALIASPADLSVERVPPTIGLLTAQTRCWTCPRC